MGITVIKDQKKGSISINKTDQDCIDSAVEQVMEMSKGSQPDEAYDIADQQPPQIFSKGDESANLDNMYKSLKEFVEYVKLMRNVKLATGVKDIVPSPGDLEERKKSFRITLY